MYWFVGIALGVAVLIFGTALVCFLLTFYSPKRRVRGEDEYEIPPGKIYEPFREELLEWARKVRAMPCTEMSVTTPDGLVLRGKYYEYDKNAITEILFHGYRGDAERDLSGAVERCFSIGHNAILVDQRASGASDGHVITFGIKERYDVLLWVNEAVRFLGEDARLILSGVSMGAATVMLASVELLPRNVKGVLADCGYSSAREIILLVMKRLKAPAFLYPFVRLGARLYGGFDPEASSPMEAMKKCGLPILFFHGDKDRFVPHEMTERLYEACTSDKKSFVSVPEAGHGLAFSVAKEAYLKAVTDFFGE
ncbi:MAG: alpha/beta hydrolase [Clostridia bacterium]|nr:alpha/beta hydrolase [Clostridia bacterium]